MATAPLRLGLIGLGVMGEPIARNLLRTGFRLAVWNRTPAKAEALRSDGARVLGSPAAVFADADAVFLVLADGAATDIVLGRTDRGFAVDVRGTTVVSLATEDPAYSAGLGRALEAAGATYVEAPVSGSRGPAEAGSLLVLAAGAADAVARLRPAFDAIGKATRYCGAVPGALRMKLANNHLLIVMLEALVEATRFADGLGLGRSDYLGFVLDGPMANDVFRQKAALLLSGDAAVQAPLRHVLKDVSLVDRLAREAGVAAPAAAAARALFEEAAALGFGDHDVLAVAEALRARDDGGGGGRMKEEDEGQEGAELAGRS